MKLLTLSLALLLAGCQSLSDYLHPKPAKPLVVFPPGEMLQTCQSRVDLLPKDAYASLSIDERELFLATQLKKSLNDLSRCNTQLKSLQDWSTKQKENLS